MTEQVKGTDETYTSARARRMLAMAEQAELDLQVKKGTLHRQDDLEFWLGLLLGNTCDRLLAVPSRTMHSLVGLTNVADANRIVADAIELALIDLRKAKVSDFKQESEAYLRSIGIARQNSSTKETAKHPTEWSQIEFHLTNGNADVALEGSIGIEHEQKKIGGREVIVEDGLAILGLLVGDAEMSSRCNSVIHVQFASVA